MQLRKAYVAETFNNQLLIDCYIIAHNQFTYSVKMPITMATASVIDPIAMVVSMH